MSEAILQVDDLSIHYHAGERPLRAVNEVSLRIDRGQALGIVGESGSGKSTLALAMLGLLDGAARITSGRVLFKEQDLYAMTPEERRSIRGRRISMVFQDPFTSLNPALTVGRQIAEPLNMHRGMAEAAAMREAERLLGEVGIPDPARMRMAYPHQLSGGMKQRALIATALACDPELLILDEPTTALDVTIEAQILDLLEQLRTQRQLSLMFISHNLGVISRVVDDVCVLYAGDVVEYGAKARVLRQPRHPYSKGLLASLARITRRRHRLQPIPGNLPDLSQSPPGCIFHSRCPFAQARCEREPQAPVDLGDGHVSRCWRTAELRDVPWRVDADKPAVASAPPATPSGRPIIRAEQVSRAFELVGGLAAMRLDFGGGFPIRYEPVRLQAVDRVSLTVQPGETVGLVGESGCGKSTLGRCLIRLIEPQAGMVELDGQDLLSADPARRRALMRTAQIIFQNPDSSLNPRKTVREILTRPLRLFGLAGAAGVDAEVDRLLNMVRLSARFATRYPHQMSGGEKQRVGIARALATGPKFIVCDEAVSALDVSVQASILNLLSDLRDELGLAYLFISHDLSVISHIADRVCVMYRGAIVESGPIERVLAPPYHPYTEALLSAVPVVGDEHAKRQRIRLGGSVAQVTADVCGCRFADRCPRKLGALCETEPPPVRADGDDHTLACHLPLEELRAREPLFERAPRSPDAQPWGATAEADKRSRQVG